MVASTRTSCSTGTSFTGRTSMVTALVFLVPSGSVEDSNPNTKESFPWKSASGVYWKNAFPAAYAHEEALAASAPPHRISTSPFAGGVITE